MPLTGIMKTMGGIFALAVLLSMICTSEGNLFSSIMANLKFECSSCNDAIETMEKVLSNKTKLEMVIKSLDASLFSGDIFHVLPEVKKLYLRDVDSLLKALAETIRHEKKDGNFCVQTLQCDKIFNYEEFKAKISLDARTLTSILSSYDRDLSSRIFRLFRDEEV
ncbi:Uncharacterised protein r2_g4247 [Pycnogonum litorale]